MTRGEFIAVATLAFAIFAALLGMLLSLVIDVHQTTRKNTEDLLKLEKQIMEMRYAQSISDVHTTPEDSKASTQKRRTSASAPERRPP